MQKKKIWYVYILKCKDRTLYTGITTDVAHRVKIHNDGKGAKYTRARRPVVLKWKKRMRDESKARKEERRIKKMRREEKITLIQNAKSKMTVSH